MDEIEQVNQYLEQNDLTIKYFAETLWEYLDSSITKESFYQRHYALLKREYKSIKPEERKAYLAWIQVQDSPHKLGGLAYKLSSGGVDRKVDQMRKWLSSGIFNPTKARRMTGEIKELFAPIQKTFNGTPENVHAD